MDVLKSFRLIPCALVLVVGCGTSSETSGPDAGLAVLDSETPQDAHRAAGDDVAAWAPRSEAAQSFWDAFVRHDTAQLAAVIADLEAASEADSTDAEVVLLLGLAYLWELSQIDTNDATQMLAAGQASMQSISYLEEAVALAPTDFRINAWLGVLKLRMGQALGNQDILDEGTAILDEGVANYPEFNLFSRSLVAAMAPANDPEYQEAVEAVFSNMDECVEDTVDRANPDLAPYMDQFTRSGGKRVCWNAPRALHNLEGASLFFGDILVKNGDVAAGIIAYNNAKLSPDFASWDFAELLTSRLDEAEERAAMFGDDDDTNDPESIWSSPLQCAVCHND